MKRLSLFLATVVLIASTRASAQVVENVARPAIQRIQVNGANLPREATINFVGGIASDDPGNLRINVSVGGGSGSFPPLANDPGSPTAGQTWYNTTSNQFTFYNGTVTSHVPLDFAGTTLAGDVIGTIGANTVVAFQNRAFSSAAPSTSNVIYWNGAQWVPNRLTSDDLGPAFAVTLVANGFSTTQEVGATITNPQFTDSHNQTPSTATVQDNVDTQNIAPATLTALGYAGAANTFPARTYQKTTINQTVSWTYSATNAASITRTAAVTAAWRGRTYWDVQAPPGLYNAAFITGLASTSLTSGFAGTFAFGAGGGTKKLELAFPTVYGTPNTFKDNATGFGVDMVKQASAVAVTNAFGVVVNYDVWESVNLLSAAVTVVVN